MFAKLRVNGADAAPLYKYLKAGLLAGGHGGVIPWNFASFLVVGGKKRQYYSPDVNPLAIEADIVAALEEMAAPRSEL